MTILAHDVQAKQPERDRLQADVEAWIARHGQPVCYPPTVTTASPPSPLTTEERRAKAIRQHKARPVAS